MAHDLQINRTGRSRFESKAIRLALCLLAQLTFGLLNVAAKEIELVVAADGSAKYKTVQEAVMAVPAGSSESPVIIRIKPGIYKELIYVQREKRFFKFYRRGC